jgi:chloramphenicol 3-O phosphotransferase
MAPGNVVILNGTSSAGKTTIAAAVQDVMDEAYVHLGIDHFGLPERFNVRTEEAEPAAADGFLIMFRDGRLVDVRLGPLGYRLRDGMYRAIAGLAEAGNHVVADDVIWDPRVLRSAVEALRHLPVLFVGVRCPLEVAERWEHERGDRSRARRL